MASGAKLEISTMPDLASWKLPVSAFSNHTQREQRMFLCSCHVLSPHLTVTSEKSPVRSSLGKCTISIRKIPKRKKNIKADVLLIRRAELVLHPAQGALRIEMVIGVGVEG
jgi:hypothetical protein